MLSDAINTDELLTNPSPNLDGALSEYDTVLSTNTHDLKATQRCQNMIWWYGVIHKHARFKSHTTVSRPTVSWFTDEIREVKRVLRQYDRKWRRTRLNVPRQIFQNQRLRRKDLIDANETCYFNTKIGQCAVDQKVIFKIVNKTLHTADDCSLPPYVSEI